MASSPPKTESLLHGKNTTNKVLTNTYLQLFSAGEELLIISYCSYVMSSYKISRKDQNLNSKQGKGFRNSTKKSFI